MPFEAMFFHDASPDGFQQVASAASCVIKDNYPNWQKQQVSVIVSKWESIQYPSLKY